MQPRRRFTRAHAACRLGRLTVGGNWVRRVGRVLWHRNGFSLGDKRAAGRYGRMGLLAACAGLLLLSACATPSRTVSLPPPSPQAPPAATASEPVRPRDEHVRVALLLPLSGRNAAVGQALLEAAQMALFDLADERFELLPRDTEESADGAIAATRAAAAEQVRLILGPLFGSSAKAAGPVAAELGIPVLSFSNDASAAGGNVWVLGFQPGEQVVRVLTYARAQALSRFAILAPNDAYGEATVTAARRAFADAADLRIIRYAPSGDPSDAVRRLADFDARHKALEQERERLQKLADGGDTEAVATLRRLAKEETFGEAPFDAVLLAEGDPKLRELAPMLPYYDVDPGPVRFLGTGRWDEPNVRREPALIGGWFAAPDPTARADFEKRFAEIYSHAPPRIATLAYDAVALAVVLAQHNMGQPYSAASLTNANGFKGVDGAFRLLPAGITERALAIIEVQKGAFQVIDPAPTTFERPES